MPECRGTMPHGSTLTLLVWSMLSACTWIRESISRPRKNHIDGADNIYAESVVLAQFLPYRAGDMT